MIVFADYKLHGEPGAWLSQVDMPELHKRNAEPVCKMLKLNGGLYLKAGQAVAVQDEMLPIGYQRMFDSMFDDALAGPWSDVEEVIRGDFGGRSAGELFGPGIEHVPQASASIAQVYCAQLPNRREVAVKVQYKQIQKQLSWDLWTLKSVRPPFISVTNSGRRLNRKQDYHRLYGHHHWTTHGEDRRLQHEPHDTGDRL